ncbi:hypothetical protein VTK73DRAFT_9689 [Phialemonium thermophilum]|uniref:Uncharacterized protein n=1 Tax=Phialemonium thermophilum TaxID=223376 RepID=A0ABR3W0S3_9PEZI
MMRGCKPCSRSSLFSHLPIPASCAGRDLPDFNWGPSLPLPLALLRHAPLGGMCEGRLYPGWVKWLCGTALCMGGHVYRAGKEERGIFRAIYSTRHHKPSVSTFFGYPKTIPSLANLHVLDISARAIGKPLPAFASYAQGGRCSCARRRVSCPRRDAVALSGRSDRPVCQGGGRGGIAGQWEANPGPGPWVVQPDAQLIPPPPTPAHFTFPSSMPAPPLRSEVTLLVCCTGGSLLYNPPWRARAIDLS